MTPFLYWAPREPSLLVSAVAVAALASASLDAQVCARSLELRLPAAAAQGAPSAPRDMTVAHVELVQGAGGTMFVDLPIRGAERRLALEPFSLRSPGFEVQVFTAAGEYVHPVDDPRTVRGEVVGYQGTTVLGSLLPDGFHGQIYIPSEGVFGVQPLASLHRGSHPQRQDSSSVAAASFGSHVVQELGEALPVAALAASTTNRVAPAVCIADSDYAFFVANGSSAQAVVDDVELLMNLANAPFEQDVAVQLQLSRVVVRQDGTNLAYPSRNTDDILGKNDPTIGMPGQWSNRFPKSARDLVVLFSGKNLVLAIGMAQLPVLGAAVFGGIAVETSHFCVFQRLNDDTKAAVNIAHEIGHVWGAEHCDDPCTTVMEAGPQQGTLDFGPIAIGQITGKRDLLAEMQLDEANVVNRSISSGSVVAGQDIRNLDVSDDRYMVLDSAASVCDLELEALSPYATSSTIEVTYELNVPDGTDVEVELFNWTTGQFVPFDSYSAVRSDDVVRRFQLANSVRYIGSGVDEGVIKARIEATRGSGDFTLELDAFKVLSTL